MRRTYRSKKDMTGVFDHRDALHNMDEKSSAFDAFYIQNIKQTKRELSCVGSSNPLGIASNKVRKRKYVKRIVKETEILTQRQSASPAGYLTPDKSFRVNKQLDPFDLLLNSSPACQVVKAPVKVDAFDALQPKKSGNKKYTRKKVKTVRKIYYCDSDSSDSCKENSSLQCNVTDIRSHELIVEREPSNSPKHVDESIDKIINNLSLLSNIKRKSNISFNTSFKNIKNRLSRQSSLSLQKSPLCSTPFKEKYRGKSIYVFSPISTQRQSESPNYVTITEENGSNNSTSFVPKITNETFKSSKPVTPTQVPNNDKEMTYNDKTEDNPMKMQGSDDIFDNEIDKVVQVNTPLEKTHENIVNNLESSLDNSLPGASNTMIEKNHRLLSDKSLSITEVTPFLGFPVAPEENIIKNTLEERNLISEPMLQTTEAELFLGFSKVNESLMEDKEYLLEHLEDVSLKGNNNNDSSSLIYSKNDKTSETNECDSSYHPDDKESMYDTCSDMSNENMQRKSHTLNVKTKIQPVVFIERMSDGLFTEYYKKMQSGSVKSTSTNPCKIFSSSDLDNLINISHNEISNASNNSHLNDSVSAKNEYTPNNEDPDSPKNKKAFNHDNSIVSENDLSNISKSTKSNDSYLNDSMSDKNEDTPNTSYNEDCDSSTNDNASNNDDSNITSVSDNSHLDNSLSAKTNISYNEDSNDTRNTLDISHNDNTIVNENDLSNISHTKASNSSYHDDDDKTYETNECDSSYHPDDSVSSSQTSPEKESMYDTCSDMSNENIQRKSHISKVKTKIQPIVYIQRMTDGLFTEYYKKMHSGSLKSTYIYPYKIYSSDLDNLSNTSHNDISNAFNGSHLNDSVSAKNEDIPNTSYNEDSDSSANENESNNDDSIIDENDVSNITSVSDNDHLDNSLSAKTNSYNEGSNSTKNTFDNSHNDSTIVSENDLSNISRTKASNSSYDDSISNENNSTLNTNNDDDSNCTKYNFASNISFKLDDDDTTPFDSIATDSNDIEHQEGINIIDSDDVTSNDDNAGEEEDCVSFVTTRRRNNFTNDSMFIFDNDNSYVSSGTDCDKTVLSNKISLTRQSKGLNESKEIIVNEIKEPKFEEEILAGSNINDELNRVTIRKSRVTRHDNMDYKTNDLTDKTTEESKVDDECNKIQEENEKLSFVGTRKNTFRESNVSCLDSSRGDVKPGIVLRPGKKWERSLSIYRRMTMVGDHFDRSFLEEENMQLKGRNYRQSVISTMEMQDSLHNESITSRRSTFVSKPSRPTIRFVKDTNGNDSRVSLNNTTVYDDLKGFLNEECDDTVIELSKLSLADSHHEVTVLEPFHESERVTTAKDYVLRRCNQTEPILFDECYPDTVLKNCHKIGEGVYGEVFLWRARDGRARVMKIVPIAGQVKVNGEQQKDFHEIISEIVIAMELSALRAPIAEIDRLFQNGKQIDEIELHAVENATDVFNEVLAVRCVYGPYPSRLLDLWELYDECKGSENDNPASLPVDQQYIVLELANAGQDLESFQFTSAQQAHALFQQIAFGLAVGEEAFQFEHRDLHWGNVLIAPTEQKYATFVLRNRVYRVPRGGVSATIIDYSLSRVSLALSRGEGVVPTVAAALYNDLATDDALFDAVGDYQFEVYRLMKDKLGNEWKNFEPYTNILWLHYTVDKMITALRYKRTNTKIHKHYIEKLKGIKDRILTYGSATDYVLTDNEI